MKLVRAFDLDDLLFDFMNPFLKWHNAKYETFVSKEQVSTYKLEEIFRVSTPEMIGRFSDFFSSTEFENIPVYEGAYELMNSLNNGDTNLAITARHSNAIKTTPICLDKHFPNKISGVYFTHEYKKYSSSDRHMRKVDICIELGVKIISEDSYKNCLECAEAGIKAFVLRQPWNKEQVAQNKHPLVYPINSLKELIAHREFIS